MLQPESVKRVFSGILWVVALGFQQGT